MQLAKEEQAKRQAGNIKGKKVDSQEEAPEHEKARLLTTESRDALGLSLDPDLEARLPRERQNSRRSGSITQVSSPEVPEVPITPNSGDQQQERSEKARGKMRERHRPESLELSGSLERIAAAGVGRNGFVPTQDWVTSWQQGYVHSCISIHLYLADKRQSPS